MVLWALAASLVPYMQKGNDTARSVHIAANTINLGLFAWQARADPLWLGDLMQCALRPCFMLIWACVPVHCRFMRQAYAAFGFVGGPLVQYCCRQSSWQPS